MPIASSVPRRSLIQVLTKLLLSFSNQTTTGAFSMILPLAMEPVKAVVSYVGRERQIRANKSSCFYTNRITDKHNPVYDHVMKSHSFVIQVVNAKVHFSCQIKTTSKVQILS